MVFTFHHWKYSYPDNCQITLWYNLTSLWFLMYFIHSMLINTRHNKLPYKSMDRKKNLLWKGFCFPSLCQLRARRALSIFKDVPLGTRRVLLLYNVYVNSTLLVLNGTSLNSDSALLALNWWFYNIKKSDLDYSQYQAVSLMSYVAQFMFKWFIFQGEEGVFCFLFNNKKKGSKRWVSKWIPKKEC